MKEEKFWEIIELSWQDNPTVYNLRENYFKTNDSEILEKLSEELEDIILENYNKRLFTLSKEDLTKFIHILEEKLYNIDREEIHEFTDGSDDGFLYCRCFILAMGKQYYDMINQTPSRATFDLEAEMFGFSAYSVYEEKFGEEFDRYSIHCIESFSNENGWAQE